MMTPELKARNRKTLTRLCAGIFGIYSAFWGIKVGLAHDPMHEASKTFNAMGQYCTGQTGLMPLLNATACLYTGAGSAGIAVGGIAGGAYKALGPSPSS